MCFFVQSGKFCKREIIAVLKASTMVTGGLSGQWCGLSGHKDQPSSTKTQTAFITLIWLCTHTHTHTHTHMHMHTHIYLYSSSQSHTIICVQLTEKHLTLLFCLFLASFLPCPDCLCVSLSILFPVSLSIFFPNNSDRNCHTQH